MESQTKAPAPTLKDKLAQQLSTGNVKLSSSDVASFAQPEVKNEPVVGDVKSTVPGDMKQVDTMLAVGVSGDPGKEISKNSKSGADTSRLISKLATDDTTLPDSVTITQGERDQFVECIVTGKRFELGFTLFGGKISGKFRSRSQNESNAILARLNWETDNKQIHNALEFSMRLRNMLLAAQVVEIRNTKFVELKGPLYRTQVGEQVTEPGWLDQVATWVNEHEGLVAAIYRELQIFEQKYWVMVNNASEQNFWHPAESTLG